MIHDALLVLWDCSVQPDKKKYVNFANDGDSEIFGWICDLSKSHHRIKKFIEESSFYSRKIQPDTSHRSIGLYSQALGEGMAEVMQIYKQTLIEVEKLIIENHTYTLSFIYSHVEKYRGLFNTLNRIISSVKEQRLNGCQILSLTHQHILTGNEIVHDSVTKIFSNVNKVFINQLCSWMLYGELKDPYLEFFIYQIKKEESASDTFLTSTLNVNGSDKNILSCLQDSSIECEYNINPNMIPYFIPLSLAQEIFFIGKTVVLFGFDPRSMKKSTTITKSLLALQSFGCTDARRFTIWEEKEPIFHDKLQKLKGPDFETSNLKIVVLDVKECVTKHLWFVAVEEAQLMHELKLLKDFYLLGRGELFLELLRLTAHMLDNPTTRTSTRDINHAFQLAARAVFLGSSADIEKFTFELPYVKPTNVSANTTEDENSSSTVSDGWSSILLKYNFKWPLHLLFTAEVLARYNDMFRLLLRIKKTQHDLHALWKTYKQSTSFSMCQLHNKLMFLMDNLQHYLQADVLETNFAKLMDAVTKTNDFEVLKRAHATYLADVLSQSFLTVTTSEELCSEGTDWINNPVFSNIIELLKLCHSFCCMSESVCDREAEDYYLRGYTERFNKLVKQLMHVLVSFRDRPCGVFLARLLMRLDYNRWLSGEAQLTQSVTNMLR